MKKIAGWLFVGVVTLSGAVTILGSFIFMGAIFIAFYCWPLILLVVGGRYMGWW